MEKFNYKKWILEHKKNLAEKVKPGSEKRDKLPDGRTVTRYTAVSSKGKETPMISFDDNLEGPGDKKDTKPSTNKKSDDKEKTEGPKKFPFIGPKGKEFEVKMFDICPSAESLYTELQNKSFRDNPEMLNILRSAAIQHERLFVIEKTALDDKSASEAQIKCAEDVVRNIKKFAREMSKENEHNYLQAHIDKIKKIHKENPREDKDNDCPDLEDLNNKDSKRFRISKQSTTYGPSNPAPTYSEGLKEIAIELGYLNEEYSKIEQEWDKLSSDEHQSIIDDVLSGEARFNDYEKDFDELKSDYGSEFTSAIADYVGIKTSELNEEENYQNLPTPDRINLSYTDPGFRFYGMYLYKDGKRFAKISYEDRATKYLKNLGINTEIPRSFDTDILDKIKQEIEALGIEGDYDAAMDVS